MNRVAVFGPHSLLSITVEALTPDGGDDIHLHAAERPVVDAGKDVAVEVDQGGGSQAQKLIQRWPPQGTGLR